MFVPGLTLLQINLVDFALGYFLCVEFMTLAQVDDLVAHLREVGRLAWDRVAEPLGRTEVFGILFRFKFALQHLPLLHKHFFSVLAIVSDNSVLCKKPKKVERFDKQLVKGKHSRHTPGPTYM